MNGVLDIGRQVEGVIGGEGDESNEASGNGGVEETRIGRIHPDDFEQDFN